MERYLLLKAIEENWGLIGPGSWTTITWNVFSDGTYNTKTTFLLGLASTTIEDQKKNYLTTKGKMEEDALSELKAVLNTKQWRNPNIESYACDGTAWEIKYYSPEGEVLNDSGKLGYIYGEECLERITSLLPETDEMYDFDTFLAAEELI